MRALNELAAVRTLGELLSLDHEHRRRCACGISSPVSGSRLKKRSLTARRTISPLPGSSRGMGPVRSATRRYEHFQHDTYGNLILGAAPAFFDTRLFMTPGAADFASSEIIGERAFHLYDEAGRRHLGASVRAQVFILVELDVLGGLRSAGQDCVAFPRTRSGLFLAPSGLPTHPRCHPDVALGPDKRNAFVESFGWLSLDASVLMMGERGLSSMAKTRALWPRWSASRKGPRATGPHLKRYEDADDFGKPGNGFQRLRFLAP